MPFHWISPCLTPSSATAWPRLSLFSCTRSSTAAGNSSIRSRLATAPCDMPMLSASACCVSPGVSERMRFRLWASCTVPRSLRCKLVLSLRRCLCSVRIGVGTT